MIYWPIGTGFPNRSQLFVDNELKDNSLSIITREFVDDMRDEYAIEVPGTFLALRTEGDLFVNDTRRDSYMTVCKEDWMRSSE